MSDALLKNTFQKISLAYELVADVTVGTATTQVDFSGLNFGKDDDLLLVSEYLSTVASGSQGLLIANNNTSNLLYYRQTLYADSTTFGSIGYNDNRFVLVEQNKKTLCSTNIKITNNGYFVWQSNYLGRVGESKPFLQNEFGSSTFTLTSLTTLSVKSTTPNGIGIGSRFQLYRLKAKKVADIIVSSATTQVDITGLSIDKDSEYMLVSNVVNSGGSTGGIRLMLNNNTTLTNYYTQELYATSTTVGAGRLNNSVAFNFLNGSWVTMYSKLKLTNNGYGVLQNDLVNAVGTSTVNLAKTYETTTFTMSSITQVNISSNLANGIGSGSRFTLYKMR